MKKILIVGAGGIGSFLARNLHELSSVDDWDQLPGLDINFVDDDTVDTDNLGYQCYETDEVIDDKVEALENKYLFKGFCERVESPDFFKGYDCIVSAVDNTSFRKMLFKYAAKNKDVYWIDLRSEGKIFSMYTKNKKNTLKKMLATIPEDKEGGSCQNEFEKSNGIIQTGNRIVAAYGAQAILNWFRGDYNVAEINGTM